MTKESPSFSQSISEIVIGLQRRGEDEQKREESERQNRIAESMKTMKDLGVTQIFEDLRDSGKLAYFRHEKTHTHKGLFGFVTRKTYIDKVDPSRIEYSSRVVGMNILFDAKSDIDREGFTVLRHPCLVYVEKKDNNIFIGWNETEYSRNHDLAYKTQNKDLLPELIAKAIYKASPNVQFTNPPTKIERFRRRV